MNLGRNIRIGLLSVGIAVLICGTLFAAQRNNVQYFFDKKPYIHPRIIEDLTTWISDSGEQVVAINLLESMNTNRYYGDIKESGKKPPFIYYEKTGECKETGCLNGPPSFGYQFIGKSSSGVIVLLTESSGGGTGLFTNLLLVSVEKDKGLSYDQKNKMLRLNRERWLIKKLGDIALGDRYDGNISVKGDVLLIGKDKNSYPSGLFKKDTAIKIDLVR
jgi:hypothetical protein